MTFPQKVQVILPVYNEGPDLVDLIGEIRRVLDNTPHKIIVVDDGSMDGAVTEMEQADLPDMEILRHPQNRGLGEAVKTGLVAAIENDPEGLGIAVVMDADNTHPPDLIPVMLAGIEKQGFDVVIASRFVSGATVEGVTLFRQLMSCGASWLFRLFLPVENVRDYTCGYRAYRLAMLKKAFAAYQGNFVTETGFSCMADILLKLHKLGAKFTEVPLQLRYNQKRSISKMKVFATIVQSLRLIAHHRFS